MDDRFEQLCLGHLPQLGLKPACKGQEVKNGVGFTFDAGPWKLERDIYGLILSIPHVH